MNVAIIGSGNIGIDLLVKVIKSPLLNCILVAGRRKNSQGMVLAQKKGVKTSDKGIEAVLHHIDEIDIVMDCSSAAAHKIHWDKLKNTAVKIIDLTPSNIGIPIVPSVNLLDALQQQNLSLITCGGQGAIPIGMALQSIIPNIEYIEVLNTIASQSAGKATRDNLDEYLSTTENTTSTLTGIKRSKAILILNPATPCINMKTSIIAITEHDIDESQLTNLEQAVNNIVANVAKYIPGYKVLLVPKIDKNRVMVTIEVTGKGDYLPSYAGNLDVITCAAVNVAEFVSQNRAKVING